MGTNVTGTMKWDPWAPQPFGLSEDGGPMLFRGTVTNHYTGELEGKGSQETLIITQPDGASEMVAVERLTGKLGGRTGGFVLRLAGTVRPGRAEATWTIVPGSGTGELAGVRGGGGYFCEDIGPNGHAEFTLDYELG